MFSPTILLCLKRTISGDGLQTGQVIGAIKSMVVEIGRADRVCKVLFDIVIHGNDLSSEFARRILGQAMQANTVAVRGCKQQVIEGSKQLNKVKSKLMSKSK